MAGAAVQARPPEPSPSPLQLRLQQQQQVRRLNVDGQDRTSYGPTGAGAGGKTRSAATVNRRKTPYDRPAQGRHASGGPQAAALLNGQSQARESRGAWLGSGLVGTASKFLTNGASYLLSSVFRRRPHVPLALTYGADTSVVGEEEEPRDGIAQSSPSKTNDLSDGRGRTFQHNESDVAGTSNELNILLKKQTLSSEEYARLTQLLQLRVVDNGVNKEQEVRDLEMKSNADVAQKQIEADNLSDMQRWRDQPVTQLKESWINGVQNGPELEHSLATPGGVELNINNGPNSPVEIARAYMGERVVRGPGSASPAKGQKVFDGNVAGSGLSPLPSSSRALVPKEGTNEVSHNIFQTPAARPARPQSVSTYTPYSRPVHVQGTRELAVDASLESAVPSRWTPIRVPISGGPQSLKRRSTVLDDGWASVGPIRRTRRKSLAASTTPSFGLTRGLGFPGDNSARDSSLFKTPLRGLESGLGIHGSEMAKEGEIDQRKSAVNPSSAAKLDDRMDEAGGLATVPVQSTETARKILETLDRITSSPKGKLLDDELALIKSRPQPPLTMGMLNDHAQRSMQDPAGLTTHVAQSSQAARPSGHVFRHFGANSSQAVSGAVTVREARKTVSTRMSADTDDVETETKVSEATTVLLDNADGHLRGSEPPVESGLAAIKKDGFRMNVDTDGSDSDHDGGSNPPGLVTSGVPQHGAGIVTSSLKASSAGPDVVKVSTTEPTKSKSFGGFTFPVSAAFGNSMEPPPTPKAMPSPSMNGGTAIEYASAHVFQFGTGPAQSHRVNFSAFSTGLQDNASPEAQSIGLKKESQPTLSKIPPLGTSPSATPSATPSLRIETKSASIVAGSNLAAGSSVAPGIDAGFPPPTLRPAATESQESQSGTASFFLPKTESAPILPRQAPVFGAPGPFGTGVSSAAASNSSVAGEKVSLSILNAGLGSSSGFAFGTSPSPQPTTSVTDNATGSKVAPPTGGSAVSGLFGFSTTDPKPAEVSALSSAPLSTPTSTPISAPPSAATTGNSQPFATAGQIPYSFSTPSVAATTTVSTVLPPVPPAFGNNPGTSLFGTPSASSSGFGLGTPSSSFGAGSTSVFGSASNPPPLFAGFSKDAPVPQASTAPAFGSSFGASPAPNSPFNLSTSKAELAPFAFGLSGAGAGTSTSGGMFQFSANVGTPASSGFGTVATTGPVSQPIFGAGQASPAFGAIPVNGGMAGETGGEHTGMEDMAEEPIQPVAASAPLSIFQQPSAPSTFVFGQPSVGAQASVFSFSQPQTQPNSFQAPGASNPFGQPSGALDYGGGVFSLGSGGSEQRPGRRIIKPKRTGSAKRGK